jgi:chaperone modulatory protein CbpM
MMRLSTVAGLLPGIAEVEITSWISRGWVAPDVADDGSWAFATIDVARVRLIRDLRSDLGVHDEMIPLVLSLLDQVYELRSAVQAMSRALELQPEPVRQGVRAALLEQAGKPSWE